MKKIISTIFLLGMLGTIQAEAFKIQENRASGGFGFGWKNKEPYSNSTHFPSPNVLIERSVIPVENIGVISVGAQFGFHYGYHKGTVPLSTTTYRESWTEVYFVPRLALYFQEVFYEYDFPENIDWYGGVGFGFNHLTHFVSNEIDLEDNSGFKLGYSFFVGGRYYFKPHAAAFAEFGFGLSYLTVGMSIRY